MKQLDKKYETEQVKELLGKYERGRIKREALEEVLEISKAHFFRILKEYRKKGEGYRKEYKRKIKTNKVEEGIDELIHKELEEQRELIKDRGVRVYRYNYSYAVGEILREYGKKVSVETIINRAKEWGYYKSRRSCRRVHDREVNTNKIGKMIQHDSSHHLFAPYGSKKWYLITSIDDYSRMLLEARFVEAESSVEHISHWNEFLQITDLRWLIIGTITANLGL
jgi:hypothetical protein